MRWRDYSFFSVLIFLAVSFASCTIQSYPPELIKKSLADICRIEYGIQNVGVKIKGGTVGVYLPLEKLFAADFKEAAVTGKVRNLEALFEPSPDALEKVEDVLFSISRVLLSTDEQLKFYVLLATDVENTGMQLVLTGYVDDIKRVRIWDISRDEYRKRVIHELRLNRAVKWHQPVRQFFTDIGTLPPERVRQKYFQEGLPTETIRTLFYGDTGSPLIADSDARWEILEIRSAPFRKAEVLVYAKVKAPYEIVGFEGEDEKYLQYLFMVSLAEEEPRLVRIIPFQFLDEEGYWQRIPFPEELQVEENVENWEQEFDFDEIKMGDFLAEQLTRRLQGVMATDERIHNTFRQAKMTFSYDDTKPPHFSLSVEAALKDYNSYTRESVVYHEDMLYLLNLASREFVNVLRSYQFGQYEYLSLVVAEDPDPWILGRESLEQFRRKKVDLNSLLSVPRL
ncbi:MAG: hypothetical protein JW893_06840 [Candidatus Omnitrophica bacterium]|nr:hypothetical protein [Candidatus Omnitrophota bacterium]